MKQKILMLITLLLFGVGTALGQTITVKGTVVDENNDPVPVATVRLKKDANKGTFTDMKGNFTLEAQKGDIILISFVGYKTLEVPAKAEMGTIKLVTDAEVLQDLVVVAYGVTKKESLTGAVSVVSSDQLSKRITTNATAALEGSAPGVQVNNSYGEPGAAPSIRIRGIGTLGAQSPLYVVDGVPFEGNISEINSNDIASFSILKDAASTALYGSRAANGVILITTKSGKSGKPAVTLSVNQGIYTRGIPEYDRLDPTRWMEVSWIAMKNFAMNGAQHLDATKAAQYATEHLVDDYVKNNIFDKEPTKLFDENGKFLGKVKPGYDDLDWMKAIERTGHRQDYNVSGSYSNDKMSVYASFGFLKEKGYIQATDFQRFSSRINSSFTPTKWLSIGINLSANSSERNYNGNAEGSAYKNPFSTARYMAPVYPIYLHNQDGSIVVDQYGEKVYDTESDYLTNRHIFFELLNDIENTKRNVLGMQSYATITMPYGFSFTVKGDLNKANNNYLSFGNSSIGDGAANGGRLSESSTQYTNYTFQQLLNWNYTFNDLHNVEVLLGHENYNYDLHYGTVMNTGMAVDGPKVLNNFLKNSYANGYEDTYRTESYFSRLKYNFDNKYIVEGSFRHDGSSRFHPDRRWGDFFSIGASWNMSNEDFMKDVKWVDFLKFRTSYGEVGNDASVGYYGWMALYDIDKNAGTAALVKNSLDASDIKWETTQTIDFGFDGRLFNKLDFSIGYFDKRSLDLLFEVRKPLSAGSYPWDWDDGKKNMVQNQNIGTISNRGVELSLNYDIFNKKDFRWSIGTEATFLKNKVVKLPEGKDILQGMRNVSEGHSIYEFYTYHFEGVDQLTGRSLYTLDPEKKAKAQEEGQLVNINGTDYTLRTDYAIRDWAGSAIPTVYGSFNTDLKWKGLGVSMLFTYSLGGKMVDGGYRSLMSTSSAASASANHVDMLNSWNGAPAGMTETSADRIDPNGIPAIDFTNSNYNNAISDRWLTDASYFTFKNLNITYDMPNRWVEKMGLSSMMLTAGIENVFIVTARKGMNPQYSFSGGYDDTYVAARVFNLGLSLKF